MLTTDLPFDEWVGTMGSKRLTGALLDRLTRRVHILRGSPVPRANGPSCRLAEAKRRLRVQAGEARPGH